MDDSFAIINDPRMETESASSMNQHEQTEEIPVKLLYSKSKVYIHPSTNTSEFIPGFLSIVEKASHDYLVAWTPEALIPSKDLEAFVQVDINPQEEVESSIMIPSVPEEHTLYAISVALDTLHSLVIKPPSFSKWYGSLILNFKSGQSSGPYWFHDDESKSTMLQKKTQGGKFTANDDGQVRWGGDEFVERLGQLVKVIKSSEVENLYLVGTEADQEEIRQTMAASRQKKAVYPPTPKQENVFESAQMDPFVATLKEARWNILEKLSRVTKFSRDAAVSILNSPATRPFVPRDVQDLCRNETVRQTVDDYDSARIFLAKWAAGLAAQSEISAPRERKYRNVGVWGHGWEEDTALGVFEVLNSENDFSIPTHTRTKPVTEAAWRSYFDEDGKLSVGEPTVRKHIFRGGLDPAVRKEAWLFLTGVYPWNSTAVERHLIDVDRREAYQSLKNRWSQDESRRNSSHFQDQKHRIDKDVHRTDRTVDIYVDESMPNPDPIMNVGTNENLEILKCILVTYNEFNTELGYVQGMSDLLSPLFAVIGEEPLAFWAFSGFMDRMKSNFYTDQSGMHKQLLTMDLLLQFMDPSLYKHFQRTDSCNFFFCFRWLLVWFKREFPWKDMLTLWEVLWTDYLTDQFHIFVALSILDQHRDVIIEYLKNFDEILKYTNDLSMTINLQETLQRAEILFYQFKQRVEAVDNKREQLQHAISSKSGLNEQEIAVAKNDLSKLPQVNELLKEILASSYADKAAANEKQLA
ncbi:GTPase activating protein [Mucor mucedo]|uniref:GTPase activating protein n=1 Tax=Mucor mucedo TaxID=29922 RepID=UPI00221FF059|nr:GTPase activating protein [Mucor mucedo]KAI7892033.1 GTPase activating protein [Mucor mucedo]